METHDVPLARRELIAARLAAGQGVAATALAAEFSVSEDAIRRDLRALAAEGRCRRVYGGALPPTPGALPMAVRSGVDLVHKRALARAAATTVRRGELLFLDNGSTNLALAELLPEDHALTVATNSVDIAAALLRRADLRLLLLGGVVDPTIGGCVDAGALLALQRLDIDRAFVGACAISAETGASAHDAADAEFKRALLAASRERVVMVTNDKLGTRAPHRFAALQALGTVIVEHDADAAALAAAGATLLRADAPV